jgi:hypothetical protein
MPFKLAPSHAVKIDWATFLVATAIALVSNGKQSALPPSTRICDRTPAKEAAALLRIVSLTGP